MDKEVLEVILKKLARESRIASILDVKSVPALPKGENYTSTILRMTLKVVLGNGRLAKKSFIVKQMITEGKSGEFVDLFRATACECHVYNEILKEMTYLMEEVGDTEESLWCNYIHFDPKSCSMILEDLKVSGYSLVPRQRGLDMDHALLALHGLGRYHAMAKVLEQRGIVSKDSYKPNPLFNDPKLVKYVFYGGLLNLSRGMLESWDPSWHEIAKKLQLIPQEKFSEMWTGCSNFAYDTEFTVLNHGDCWSNNMMFKHDFQKRPISVKFLDFQLPHYNSPCIDLTYLIYLGVQPEVRRAKYEILLKSYYDSLMSSMDMFGYSGKRPTLDEVTAKMKRIEFFGLSFFVAAYYCVICSSTEAMDMEKIMSTDGKEGYNKEILKEPGMVETMSTDIIDFAKRYLPLLLATANGS